MLPELPTDNLYKFQTVCGVILITFAGWLANDTFDKFTQTISSIAEDTSTANLARAETRKIQMELAEQVTWLQMRIKPDQPRIPDVELSAINSRIDHLRDELDESLDKLAVATTSLQMKSDKEELAKFRYLSLLLACLVVAVVGVLWSQFGFYRWQRYQTLQDDLLKEEVSSARLANSLTNSSPPPSPPRVRSRRR